jgi:hypothetical protein
MITMATSIWNSSLFASKHAINKAASLTYVTLHGMVILLIAFLAFLAACDLLGMLLFDIPPSALSFIENKDIIADVLSVLREHSSSFFAVPSMIVAAFFVEGLSPKKQLPRSWTSIKMMTAPKCKSVNIELKDGTVLWNVSPEILVEKRAFVSSWMVKHTA